MERQYRNVAAESLLRKVIELALRSRDEQTSLCRLRRSSRAGFVVLDGGALVEEDDGVSSRPPRLRVGGRADYGRSILRVDDSHMTDVRFALTLTHLKS